MIDLQDFASKLQTIHDMDDVVYPSGKVRQPNIVTVEDCDKNYRLVLKKGKYTFALCFVSKKNGHIMPARSFNKPKSNEVYGNLSDDKVPLNLVPTLVRVAHGNGKIDSKGLF